MDQSDIIASSSHKCNIIIMFEIKHHLIYEHNVPNMFFYYDKHTLHIEK